MRTPPLPSSSSRRPIARTRPSETTAARSQICSTSPRRCEFRKTAHPRSRRCADDRSGVGTADGIECRRRLIEDHQLGVAEQRDAEAETLLHSFGERLHLGVGVAGEPDGRQRPGDLRRPFGAGDSGEPAVQAEHLGGAQPALVAEELGQIAHAAAGLAVARRTAEHPRLAAGRAAESEEQLHRGGLAAAVRSEESEHLAAGHDHREAGERDRRPVVLGELEGPHRRPVRGRRRRRRRRPASMRRAGDAEHLVRGQRSGDRIHDAIVLPDDGAAQPCRVADEQSTGSVDGDRRPARQVDRDRAPGWSRWDCRWRESPRRRPPGCRAPRAGSPRAAARSRRSRTPSGCVSRRR